MNKYHDKISNEIENLRKAIVEQNSQKNSARNSHKQMASNSSTAMTSLGVDQYLLDECKKNNEYLQFAKTSRSNTPRVHTPNIYKIDSLERDLSDIHNYRANLCEKSIRSKSDFLYNVRTARNDEMEQQRKEDPDPVQSAKQSKEENERSVRKLRLKNEERMKYFRSSTPLDSTRSIKIGLQKLEDLLTENAKMNTNKKGFGLSRDSSIDYDDSLYELM